MLLPLTLVLVGCGERPQDALGWSERWELLGVLEQGGVLDARVWVGNTDLLRGEGHLRFDRWLEDESPLLSGLDAPPQAVELDEDRQGLRLQTSGLSRLPDGGWRLALAEDEIDASVTISPTSAPVAPVSTLVGGGQWAEEALVPQGTLLGWAEAGQRGGLIRGRGVLLHRGGDGWPGGSRQVVVLLGEGLSVGLDLQGGQRFAWALVQGAPLDASAATLSEDGRTLDLRPAAPLWATIKEVPLGAREPDPALLLLERPFRGVLRASGGRQISRALAEVHVNEQTLRVSGLVLRED